MRQMWLVGIRCQRCGGNLYLDYLDDGQVKCFWCSRADKDVLPSNHALYLELPIIRARRDWDKKASQSSRSERIGSTSRVPRHRSRR